MSHLAAGRRPRWPDLVDGAIDGGIVAGALWTVWYQAALIWQFDLRPSGWPFAVMALACLVVGAVRRSARAPMGPQESAAADAVPPSIGAVARYGRPLALAGAVIVLAWAVAARASIGVVPAALVAIVLIVAVTLPLMRPQPGAGRGGAAGGSAPGQAAHLMAIAASIGLGALSLVLFKSDADDAYYLNRAAWVAEHGTAALRDTMFGPGTYANSFGGGLPTPSVEALQGVVASMLGVEAGTVAYLLYTPVLAAVFGWVTWRLVRAWAPRRQALVLLVALVFVLASGASIVGSYSIGRIWQGKVTAYAVLIPLVWTYLTRAAERGSRSTIGLLFASGIVFVGLTTSSALLTPVIVCAALLAALVLRSRGLLGGAIAFAIAPMINGVAQLVGASDIGTQANGITKADQVFAIAYGSGTAMALLAVLATALAPAALHRPAAVLAGSAGVATMATFLPGVIHLADAATGAGPVVWRLAIVAPTWVFVGLLVAVPGPEMLGTLSAALGRSMMLGRSIAAGAALALTAVVVLVAVTGGHWLWSPQVGAKLSSPGWKVDRVALADVRTARSLNIEPGLWLMPPEQMQNLSISTTRQHAVVPRIFYLDTLQAPAQALTDRRVLFALAAGHKVPAPAVENVRGALQRLDVSLACVPATSARARRVLSAAVHAPLTAVGSMRCHVPLVG